MSLRWRTSLLAVLAALALSGFMPHSFEAGNPASTGVTVVSPLNLPALAPGCTTTSCGKTIPAAVTPTLAVAALAALAGMVVSAVGRPDRRRLRARVAALARGTSSTLFHPPQFSNWARLA